MVEVLPCSLLDASAIGGAGKAMARLGEGIEILPLRSRSMSEKILANFCGRSLGCSSVWLVTLIADAYGGFCAVFDELMVTWVVMEEL